MELALWRKIETAKRKSPGWEEHARRELNGFIDSLSEEDVAAREKYLPYMKAYIKLDEQIKQYKDNKEAAYSGFHGEREANEAKIKAKLNTEIERLQKLKVYSVKDIVEKHIENFTPENREKLRKWLAKWNMYEEGNVSGKRMRKANQRRAALRKELEADEAGKAFFAEIDENEYAEMALWDLDYNIRRYKNELLNGINEDNAIVVFGNTIVDSYSVAAVRGQTKISGMSRVVSLFENADKSTFVHELGHVALADLKMLAEMEGAPAQLVKDWQTVKDWLGYKDRQGFTREQHEQFARGFEAYLRTGKAPVRGLKAVFRTFKKWLCDIKRSKLCRNEKPPAMRVDICL